VGLSRILLDTSAYSAILRGDGRLMPPLQRASEIYFNPIVLGELLAGFKRGGKERENLALLREFMESPRVGVVTVDAETSERYALIHAHLRQAGKPIPANDLWIAASASQHGLRVLTVDGDFGRIPHIVVDDFPPE
jgi:predicted nucleic acid-binding protein